MSIMAAVTSPNMSIPEVVVPLNAKGVVPAVPMARHALLFMAVMTDAETALRIARRHSLMSSRYFMLIPPSASCLCSSPVYLNAAAWMLLIDIVPVPGVSPLISSGSACDAIVYVDFGNDIG